MSQSYHRWLNTQDAFTHRGVDLGGGLFARLDGTFLTLAIWNGNDELMKISLTKSQIRNLAELASRFECELREL